jgi:hypothetical protein
VSSTQRRRGAEERRGRDDGHDTRRTSKMSCLGAAENAEKTLFKARLRFVFPVDISTGVAGAVLKSGGFLALGNPRS